MWPLSSRGGGATKKELIFFVRLPLPELINLEHAEDGNGVHEGGVELEVGMVRADVVAA